MRGLPLRANPFRNLLKSLSCAGIPGSGRGAGIDKGESMDTGTVIGGAFRVVRDHPAAVAIWGLVYGAATIASTFMLQPLGNMQAARTGAISPMSWVGGFLLLELVALLFFTILMTAAQRAVLRPEEKGFAYIRFGLDELRMIGLFLLLAVLGYAGTILIFVLVAMIVEVVIAGAGTAAGVVLAIILGLGVLCLFIWLEVRLSLAFPLTLLRRRFVLGESWQVTRGHFWSLFAAYLIVILITFAMSMAAGLVTAGPYLAGMMRNLGNPEAMQRAADAQIAAQLGSISVMTVVGWILSAVAGALMIALSGGAVATAAAELVGDDEAMAETFA